MGNGRTVQRVLLQARNIHLATYNRAAGDVEQGCYAVRAESFARGAIQQGQRAGNNGSTVWVAGNNGTTNGGRQLGNAKGINCQAAQQAEAPRPDSTFGPFGGRGQNNESRRE